MSLSLDDCCVSGVQNGYLHWHYQAAWNMQCRLFSISGDMMVYLASLEDHLFSVWRKEGKVLWRNVMFLHFDVSELRGILNFCGTISWLLFYMWDKIVYLVTFCCSSLIFSPYVFRSLYSVWLEGVVYISCFPLFCFLSFQLRIHSIYITFLHFLLFPKFHLANFVCNNSSSSSNPLKLESQF